LLAIMLRACCSATSREMRVFSLHSRVRVGTD
jgi:hypothetical protein